MTVEIDIDEARTLRDILNRQSAFVVTDFRVELDNAISNADERAYDRQTEAFYGGDSAGQNQAAAEAAARKDAGR